MVHNLVQNALDAVAEHPVSVPAQVLPAKTDTPLNDDGSVRAVRLLVRDNGPGFRTKYSKSLRALYHHQGQRHGLGLTVVKNCR